MKNYCYQLQNVTGVALPPGSATLVRQLLGAIIGGLGGCATVAAVLLCAWRGLLCFKKPAAVFRH